MSSTLHFKSGLNNWLPKDKPQRVDFVNDNKIADSYICNAFQAEAQRDGSTIAICALYPVVGEVYSVQFVAGFDYNAACTVKIDGDKVNLFDSEGGALGDGWRKGDYVSIQRMGNVARVLSPLRSIPESPMPYADSCEGEQGRVSSYCKTLQGVVHANFSVVKRNGQFFEQGEQIGVFPAGYRPDGVVYCATNAVSDTNNTIFCMTRIKGDGQLNVYFESPFIGKGKTIRGTLTFLAKR